MDNLGEIGSFYLLDIVEANERGLICRSDVKLLDSLKKLNNLARQLIVLDDLDRVGTMSDGDARRAIINGSSLDDPISEIVQWNPCIVREDGLNALLDLSEDHSLHSIPIINAANKLVGIAQRFVRKPERLENVEVLIMAGGRGVRLRPYTEKVPKPLIPVGSRPIIGRIVENLLSSGFCGITVSVGYLGQQIVDYLSADLVWGEKVEFISESKPLGTAGAMVNFNYHEKHLMVLNGDLYTDIDLRKVYQEFQTRECDVLIVARKHQIVNPFGVITADGVRVQRIDEKPTYESLVACGIYCLKTSLIESLRNGIELDMPQFIVHVINQGLDVQYYLFDGLWIDIGRPSDLLLADETWADV